MGRSRSSFPAYHGRGSKGATVPVDPALLGPLVLLKKITTQVWINLGKPKEPVTFVGKADEWTVWRMLVMPRLARGQTLHPDHGTSVPSKPARSEAGAVRRRPAPTATGVEQAPAADGATGDPKLRAAS